MRDNSISICKSIAIILMVLAHTNFSHFGSVLINMFHMPLFFFFSGYCIKKSYFDDPFKYLKRRVQGIYIPFVKWSMLFLLFHNIFFHIGIYNSSFGGAHDGMTETVLSCKETLIRAFYILATLTQKEHLLGGYWFLHTLFFSSIISFIVLYSFQKKGKLHNSIMMGGILVLLMLISYFKISIPFFVIRDREVMAVFFMMLGYFAKNYNLLYVANRTFKLIVIILGLAIVWIGSEYWPCSMTNIQWQYIPLYLVSALAGTIVCYYLSQVIAGMQNTISSVLIYMGDHTLDILTWHFSCFKLVSLLVIFIYKIPYKHLAEFPTILEYSKDGWWVLYLLVGVFTPLLITYIIERIRTYITHV